MSRKHKTVTEIQDQVLSQFQKDIRSFERRSTMGRLSAVERALEEGRKNRERLEAIKMKSKNNVK